MEDKLATPWRWFEVLSWMVVALLGVTCMQVWAHRMRYTSPLNWPLLGMLPALLANMDNVYDWITMVLIENGGSFQFWGPWFTRFNYFVTSDPRNVEHVLRLNFANYPKGVDFTDIFNDLLGGGIFNVDDELWRLQRKATSLQLNSVECKKFIDATVMEFVKDKLLPVLHNFCDRGMPFDLQDLMLRFTFDTVCMVGFGVNIGCISLDHELPSVPFACAFEHALDCIARRFFLPSLWWHILKFLRVGKENRMSSSLHIINDFIDHVISTRQNEIQINKQCQTSKADLLSCFIQLGVDSHDQKFLKDISINFILAGRDTSALGLSWFFWLVATHPMVEEKIFQEVNGVISSSKESFLTKANLNKMKYLHAALSEALRLYPSVPLEIKHIMEDDFMPDGNQVRKNQKLLYSIYTMGKMESIWGVDSISFRPERWFIDDGTSCMPTISPFHYPVFNAGPRTCLGKDMAYLLMKAVASTLLLHFRIKLVPGHKVVPKLSITLYMKHGFLITLEHRQRPQS